MASKKNSDYGAKGFGAGLLALVSFSRIISTILICIFLITGSIGEKSITNLLFLVLSLKTALIVTKHDDGLDEIRHARFLRVAENALEE